jgi:valyl-tRNA synthetase
VLITAADIIFFWVARMVMAGYEFMGQSPSATSTSTASCATAGPQDVEVARQLARPDRRHGRVRRRRAALHHRLAGAAGQDVRYDREKTELGRNFANKVWNATRFALINLEGAELSTWDEGAAPADLDLPSRWILSRLQSAIDETRAALEEYRFNDAASAIYRFLWGEVCDWYLELVKPALYGEDAAAKNRVGTTLVTVLDRVMRLLHPFMPYLTEEIWQALPMQRPTDSIMVAPYPQSVDAWRDADAEELVAVLIDTVTAVRGIRSEFGIAPRDEVTVRVAASGAAERLEHVRPFVANLARVAAIEILAGDARPTGEATAAIAGLGEIFVPLGDSVDRAAVAERMQRERAKIEKELKGVDAKLTRPDFVDKAPPDIVDKEREKAAALRERRDVLGRHLAALRS